MNNSRVYFAGGNTRDGFKSCFEDIIDEKYKKLYILKGSSGCGKSTFMKRIGEASEAKGYDTEYIKCSADSDSLDGVLIPQLSLAVVDGTAPHVMDTKYPCARENIINLGDYWNDIELEKNRDKIISLINKKSDCVTNAYTVIRAAGYIRDLRAKHVYGCLNEKKLDAFISRFCKQVFKPRLDRKNNESIFLNTAFNSKGFEALPTFFDAKKIYVVKDKYDVAPILLAKLRDYADRYFAEKFIALDPIDFNLLGAIYFPTEGVLVICEKTENEYPAKPEDIKTINTERFIVKESYKGIKQKDRWAKKLYDLLLVTASKYLDESKTVHAQVEEIYIESIDFGRLTKFTNRFISKIL